MLGLLLVNAFSFPVSKKDFSWLQGVFEILSQNLHPDLTSLNGQGVSYFDPFLAWHESGKIR